MTCPTLEQVMIWRETHVHPDCISNWDETWGNSMKGMERLCGEDYFLVENEYWRKHEQAGTRDGVVPGRA